MLEYCNGCASNTPLNLPLPLPSPSLSTTGQLLVSPPISAVSASTFTFRLLPSSTSNCRAPLFRPLLFNTVVSVTITVSAGSPPISSGKFKIALLPRSLNAAVSYAFAASTAVSYVPSQTLAPFLLGSRISAANFPHGRCRTPL
ncbi:hypothetical protein HanXRQr2_Chr08g0336491 [Helianthus annuus]|uniref:Uncharacterized protein n=1 Tax=Helianthus annuus TaxID=4232 RepID=A0A9K3IES0_HELAN|nr:hypothetical protein HanXRQr2_Chr08g0336491 [Helianthus annuus]KAJ0901419.1 hypothetical protein HanPSC8_Chr08g0325101 [Helianthus annuus]